MGFNTVSVIGLGYIGLPTAAILASRGVKVIGVDVNEEAVETINAGKIHIVEPDLDIVVHGAVSAGKLVATTKPEAADAFIIAVPTPFKECYEPDLSYVHQAAKNIASVLEKGNLVILESTSPVGATEQLAQWLAAERPDLSFPHQGDEQPDINLAYCPERVLPGHVLRELVDNDRIVGGVTEECTERAKKLYEIFVQAKCLTTNCRTAEMAKLTENAYRDVNIAFANELSLISEKMNINVWELINLANRHPRVNILQPGPGVGGHCIAVDPWFIVSAFPDTAKLIRQAREINDCKPSFILEKVRNLSKNYEKPKIACLGISFKPNIDDLRESPALQITKQLASEMLGEILVVEPHVEQLPSDLESVGNVRKVKLDFAIEYAHIIVILVKHDRFINSVDKLVTHAAVIDTCGVLPLPSEF